MKDRGLVLLAKRQPIRCFDVHLLDRELHCGSQRNRLVDGGPSIVRRNLHRLNLVAPARIIERIGNQSPYGLGRACDLDGLLNPDQGSLDAGAADWPLSRKGGATQSARSLVLVVRSEGAHDISDDAPGPSAELW